MRKDNLLKALIYFELEFNKRLLIITNKKQKDS